MSELYNSLSDQFDREHQGLDLPLATPWDHLNRALGGGLRPGTINLLVGEPGSGKTYLALEMCLGAFLKEQPWAYCPFERDDTYAVRRLLAVMANSWAVLDPGKSAENRERLQNPHLKAALDFMAPRVLKNPRQLLRNPEGGFFTPACRYQEVLDRLAAWCETKGLVVLDPLSMLAFDDKQNQWQAQEQFAKDAAALVAQTRARLLLVHHTRKSVSGAKARVQSQDEAAGAAALTRFSDNVVFLEHHPNGLESEITDANGIRLAKTHRRSLFVAKARDGRGTGWRIAADFSAEGPTFRTHGYIGGKGVA